MQLRKYRWSRDYESAEEELVALLKQRGLTAERWHAEEHQELGWASYEYNKQLWCAEGSMIVTVDDDSAGGKRISLQPGDTLDLPAGIRHRAVAGFTGAVCYEARSNTA